MPPRGLAGRRVGGEVTGAELRSQPAGGRTGPPPACPCPSMTGRCTHLERKVQKCHSGPCMTVSLLKTLATCQI